MLFALTEQMRFCGQYGEHLYVLERLLSKNNICTFYSILIKPVGSSLDDDGEMQKVCLQNVNPIDLGLDSSIPIIIIIISYHIRYGAVSYEDCHQLHQ